MISKFVDHPIKPLATYSETTVFRVHRRVEAGAELSREEKDFIFYNLNQNLYSNVGIPLGGYMFDFSKYLKRFVVKTEFDIKEVFSVDAKAVKNVFKDVYGAIEYIVEVNQSTAVR